MQHQTVLSLLCYGAETGVVVDIGDRIDVVPFVGGESFVLDIGGEFSGVVVDIGCEFSGVVVDIKDRVGVVLFVGGECFVFETFYGVVIDIGDSRARTFGRGQFAVKKMLVSARLGSVRLGQIMLS